MTVSRDGAVIGTLTFPTAVGGSALGDLAHPADRSMTRLVFLDAITPNPASGAFPTMLKPIYSVTARFREAPAIQQSFTTLRLPITTPPGADAEDRLDRHRRKPLHRGGRLLKHGAARPFPVDRVRRADRRYRRRHLFRPRARLRPGPAARGRPGAGHHAPHRPEPPLPIDPETVRVVFAGEDSDESGLDAMTPLIAATASAGTPDGVHYLLPLPPGIAPGRARAVRLLDLRVPRRPQRSIGAPRRAASAGRCGSPASSTRRRVSPAPSGATRRASP